MSGIDEAVTEENIHLGGDSVPRPLGFIALMPIPVNQMFDAGARLSPSPSLVLAPESALGLHLCRALSSAPAAGSVSRTAILSNGRRKKEVDFHRAFRHVPHRAAALPVVTFAQRCSQSSAAIDPSSNWMPTFTRRLSARALLERSPKSKRRNRVALLYE
jgi:hypothetical protein